MYGLEQRRRCSRLVAEGRSGLPQFLTGGDASCITGKIFDSEQRSVQALAYRMPHEVRIAKAYGRFDSLHVGGPRLPDGKSGGVEPKEFGRIAQQCSDVVGTGRPPPAQCLNIPAHEDQFVDAAQISCGAPSAAVRHADSPGGRHRGGPRMLAKLSPSNRSSPLATLTGSRKLRKIAASRMSKVKKSWLRHCGRHAAV